ncbi:MAG TPA: hypothetical protein VLS90_05400, partial [Thermodesulfobacteriota bacterium]|nr:hypothetical protein [Thermodesulfobacteriota bacterium]
RGFQGERQGAMSGYSGMAAERIERASHYFRENDIQQLLEDAGRFIRKNPAAAAAGALALGFIAARFLKSGGGAIVRETYQGLE